MKAPPRRLRVALHAFPRRFRAARTAEILATFEEAELAGDAHPYGVPALADVVIAGWAERLRTHPPLGAYLKYRLLDGRLDARWHRWMLDDVRGLWSLRRPSSAGILGRRSVSRRFTRTIPDGAQVDLVFSDLASAGTLSAAVTAVGLIACFAPITPLIVPLTFVVMAGAAPTLVLAGIDVQRHRPDCAVIVWTPRSSEADAARTS